MRLAFVLALLAGCHLPPPKPYNLAPDAGYCAPGISPTSPDQACDARYTAAGLACVTCPGTVTDCVDKETVVMCVTSCGAPECGVGHHR